MDDRLITFLEKVVIDLKNNNVSEGKKRLLGSLYVSYNFEGVLDKDLEIEEDEAKKFLALGWYIYSNLKNQDQENDNIRQP